VLASIVRTLVPSGGDFYAAIGTCAKALLSLTLFLIGAGLSRSALKKVGVRPLLAGILLWIAVGVTSFLVLIGTR
jgi:uncharacterized membrane protein YadS